MQLTIRRVGGMLPTLRPSATYELDSLDEQTKEEIAAFVSSGKLATKASYPDATSYIFELTSTDGVLEISAPSDAIPMTIRRLLPNPGMK